MWIIVIINEKSGTGTGTVMVVSKKSFENTGELLCRPS